MFSLKLGKAFSILRLRSLFSSNSFTLVLISSVLSFFIFFIVRAFLTSVCTDVDGQDKSIKDAIEANLSGAYNILYQVVNFKDYGNPSSRTRTLVIGVRKDLKEVTPYDIFPDKQPERTLRQIIGHLPSLKKMGEKHFKNLEI